VVEGPVPSGMAAEVEAKRQELVERVSEVRGQGLLQQEAHCWRL